MGQAGRRISSCGAWRVLSLGLANSLLLPLLGRLGGGACVLVEALAALQGRGIAHAKSDVPSLRIMTRGQLMFVSLPPPLSWADYGSMQAQAYQESAEYDPSPRSHHLRCAIDPKLGIGLYQSCQRTWTGRF